MTMTLCSITYLQQLITRMEHTPIWEIMREDEASAGHEIILPGAVPWLPAEDWDETVVVSRAGNTVRLVAILAKNPGTGAFRRLIAALAQARLHPVIVAPTREMAATCQRMGWHCTVYGRGDDTVQHWEPKT